MPLQNKFSLFQNENLAQNGRKPGNSITVMSQCQKLVSCVLCAMYIQGCLRGVLLSMLRRVLRAVCMRPEEGSLVASLRSTAEGARNLPFLLITDPTWDYCEEDNTSIPVRLGTRWSGAGTEAGAGCPCCCSSRSGTAHSCNVPVALQHMERTCHLSQRPISRYGTEMGTLAWRNLTACLLFHIATADSGFDRTLYPFVPIQAA